MLATIPLLIIVVIVFNVLALVTGSDLQAEALALPLAGGQPLALSTGDLLVAAGLVLLFFEIFKSTRTGVASIVDHILSIALFVICLLELLLLPELASAPFALVTLMTLIDVIAGFTVTISSARRDFGVDRSLG